MADTIFSKIIRGEVPCFRVYEDEKVLAFLDISPLSRGHTLVIPKEPAETIDQLSECRLGHRVSASRIREPVQKLGVAEAGNSPGSPEGFDFPFHFTGAA